MPNWREALKELEKEMKANPQQEAPLPQPEAVADVRQGKSAAESESKPSHQHRTRSGKTPKAEEKSAEKPKAKKKPAAKKSK